MVKRIKELSYNEIDIICAEHYQKDFFDTCKDCPLKVKVISCVKGLIAEREALKKQLERVEEQLNEALEKEIEVE